MSLSLIPNDWTGEYVPLSWLGRTAAYELKQELPKRCRRYVRRKALQPSAEHLNITAQFLNEPELRRVMKLLARSVRRHGWVSFYTGPLVPTLDGEQRVIDAPGCGISLRIIRRFNIVRADWDYRFDIWGATA